jgi:regulator of RNase E activity RraA
MNPSIPEPLLAEFSRFDTCTIANAIESFGVRLRNEGFTDARVRCQTSLAGPMVGHAVTLRIRSGGPSMDGHRYFEGTTWWNAVLAQPAPRVVVIQDLDAGPAAGSFIGQVHAAILKVLGGVGLLTDGAVRDLPALAAAGFPVFAASVSVSHAYAHIVEWGGEIEVAGLKIRPGDWLHGDAHGVVSIPPSIGAGIPAAARRSLEREESILAACADPAVTPARLRAVLESMNPPARSGPS